MTTKNSLALISASALAGGMAQGAVVYSGPLNLQQNFVSSPGLSRQGVDMTGDGINDFAFGYEANVALKPYVDARTTVDAALPTQSGIIGVLTKANTGFPVTSAGTMIDSSFAAAYPPQPLSAGRGYMYTADGSAVIGDWSNTATTDAYVGVELALSGGTSFGWLHFIDNPAGTPQTLTLVDYAYQSAPNLGIEAGVIPEPSVCALTALGLAGFLASRRRR
jgi:hypothetical protein